MPPAPCLPTRCGPVRTGGAASPPRSAAAAACFPDMSAGGQVMTGPTDPIPPGGIRHGESRREPFLTPYGVFLGWKVRKPHRDRTRGCARAAGQSRWRPCSCAPPADLLL